MEYITVREAAEKWGISIRRVQYLCKSNKIQGAIRFNKVWAIPLYAEKPADGRLKSTQGEAGRENPKVPFFDHLILFRVIEKFPYPIQIYAPDGTMVYVNESGMELMHLSSMDKLIGAFNILTDPVIDEWGEGVRERIARSFKGETVRFYDMKIPFNGIYDRFGQEERRFDVSYQNITSFPIYDNCRLVYVVHVFATSKFYSGKEEIVKAMEYIERNYSRKFNMDEVAAAVNLSRYHFARMFKKQTGRTPYAYYLDVKIGRIKEKLHDSNLSISQAFAECGADYNGSIAKVFRKKVGMSPTEFRQSIKNE